MSTRRYLANIIKLNKDLISKIIAEVFYFCIDKVEFPSKSKHADILTIHRKKDKSDKSNYKPVSILYNYCKMYEKLIYNQLYQYFQNTPFPSQCGFQKEDDTQRCLLVLIAKFKEAIVTGSKFGALG